jgi:O-succinylbenzoate synthase
MLNSLLDTLRVVALPTKTNFRGVTVREVALFKGEHGWAEFSPFLEYDDQESAPWLACAIEAATTPAPPLLRKRIAVNGTIPAINDKKKIEEIVTSYPGVTTFKIKVGENLAEDLARVAWVKSLNSKAKIRIDVNGSWSVDDALRNLYAMFEEVGTFEYVEQPCATVEELRDLKNKIRIPLLIAGDEVLRKAKDPFALDLTGAVDYLMLKVQPLGGIVRALKMAEHHELPVIVSSALESAVGISYGLKLAAALPRLDFACGLGTASLLSSNVGELPVVDGNIQIAEFEPVFEGLDVSAERFEWWKNRIMRTSKLLS